MVKKIQDSLLAKFSQMTYDGIEEKPFILKYLTVIAHNILKFVIINTQAVYKIS